MTKEEAIEVYKGLINVKIKEAFEFFVPELRESEDEKIRKWIIEVINEVKTDEDWCASAERCDKAIAYLEKQKECFADISNTSADEDERIREELIEMVRLIGKGCNYILSYQKYEEYLAWLEKQKEQKPAEKQDYSGLNDLERVILRGFLAAGVKNVPVGIIKETEQECLALIKPAEWSYPYGRNETADRLVSIAECLEMDDCLINGYSGTECGKFLRDLARKQVECKPTEWSEEDEKVFQFVLDFFTDCWWNKKWEISREQVLKFLKSLRPSWKPSEEQISSLQAAREVYESKFGEMNCSQKTIDELKLLEKELKKL